MKLRIFDRKKEEPYIPIWDQQRYKAKTDPTFKPLTIYLRSMSYEEYEEMQNQIVYEVDPADPERMKSNAGEVRDETFLKFVTRIDNLETPDGEKIVFPGQFMDILISVKDGTKGVDANVHNLITEITKAIQFRGVLEDGLAKNWLSSSAFGLTKEGGDTVATEPESKVDCLASATPESVG